MEITDLFTEIAVYVVMRAPNMHIYSTVIIIFPMYSLVSHDIRDSTVTLHH